LRNAAAKAPLLRHEDRWQLFHLHIPMAMLEDRAQGACVSPEMALRRFSRLPTVAVRIIPKMMTRPIGCINRKNWELNPATTRMREMFIGHPHLSSTS